MPEARRGRRAPLAALVALLCATLVMPATVLGTDPPGLDQFMHAIGQVESGGRYDARNVHSGALGKYQVMPANWAAWTQQYLGLADAPPTPANQEAVARAKFIDLFEWLGSWRRVAFWWLTGSILGPNGVVSGPAKAYVDGVMALAGIGDGSSGNGASSVGDPPETTIQETGDALAYSGTWASANHPGYLGGGVRYTIVPGASVSLTFTGRGVRVMGPTGPTRGRASILVDGAAVAVADLNTSAFAARRTLFSISWPDPGQHTISIEALPSPGHQMVAVDAFLVTQ